MSTRATYSPGGWVAISTPSAWLLVDLPADHETVSRCWALLSAGAEVDAVLDAVTADGLADAPDFALARVAKEQKRVVTRGRGRAVVDGTGIESRGRVTWADVEVEDVGSLLLVGGDTVRTVELPLASGVTMACSIDIALDQMDPPTAPPVVSDPPVVTEALMASEALVVTDPPVAADGPVTDAIPTAAPDAATVELGPGRRLVLAAGATAADATDPVVIDEPAAVDEPLAAPVAVDAEPAAESYDFLFGATQNPRALPTPEQPPASQTAPAPAPEAARSPAVGAAHETASWMTQSPKATVDTSDGGGLIDYVPGMTPSAAPTSAAPTPAVPTSAAPTPAVPTSAAPTPAVPTSAAPTPSAPAPAPRPWPGSAPADAAGESLSERTVNRAALIAAAAAAEASGTPIPGPTVLAGMCPSGHLSPVHAAVCRVCGAPMPMQSGTEIPRPPLGLLRLSTGDVVMLDRGVVFGRAPEVAGDLDERPNAVRLASPENDISRSHADIELDGWHVYVRDLGSTNGTVVTLPGQPPVRLRPHDPQLLEPGAKVSLADEVEFVFEVSG